MDDSRVQCPIASILIPLHNAEHYIVETINSLLAESKISIEVIVVDDHSTDNSARLVKTIDDHRVRLLQSAGRGISAALNSGLQLARGKIIMRCDADDLYPAGRIQSQVAWLEANDEFGAVCGGFSTIDQRGKLIRRMPCGSDATEITEELRGGVSRTTLCTFAMRADTARNLGGFRNFFETAEDLDFQFRFAAKAPVAYLPEDWYLYRIHHASITHVQADSRRKFFEDFARELAIQRRDEGSDSLDLGFVPDVPSIIGSSKNNRTQNHVQGLLLSRAWAEFDSGFRTNALRTAARAVLADVTSIATWRSALALACKAAFRT